MIFSKRLIATLVVAAAVGGAAPAVASAQSVPTLGDPNLCLQGVPDYGPLGQFGPYGQYGPYGPNGPMHNQTNPMGNVASCGGTLAFILRGGTLQSFIQANLNSVQQH